MLHASPPAPNTARWQATPAHQAQHYDHKARALSWHAPAIAFGVLYNDTQPGQTLLDLGIGTGLCAAYFRKAGLRVHGLDVSEAMLAVCRRKGITDVVRHDIEQPPYPYATASMDFVVSIGVLYYLPSVTTVIIETARLLRPGGQCAFLLVHREEDASHAFEVDAGSPAQPASITHYRHTEAEVRQWLEEAALQYATHVTFSTVLGRKESAPAVMRLYVATKPA